MTNVELRAAVDRISARGAFVWAVFDACHSARLVRGMMAGADDHVRYRSVDPEVLGVSRDDLGRHIDADSGRGARLATAGAVGDSSDQTGAGSALFYATQADELTPELMLPGGGIGRERQGLFSFVVARALETAEPMTYRQLAQYVLAQYRGIADAHATPLFAGNGLDLLVLDPRSVPVRQWPLQRGLSLRMAVGSLSGIDVGAVLAVVPGPLARDGDALGYLRVAVADADHSELVPIAFADRPAPALDALPTGAFVRLIGRLPLSTLRVATQRRSCTADCRLGDAVTILKEQGVPGVDVEWVDPGSGEDLLLQQRRDEWAFLSPATPNGDPRAPAIALRAGGRALSVSELVPRLASELYLMGRSQHLLRAASQIAARAPSLGLRVTLQRRPGGSGPSQGVTADSPPSLKEGDRLVLTIDNGGDVACDLTVLYFDADLGISALFPGPAGESNRLDAGARKVIDDMDVHSPPFGLERLMLIAVEARRLAERADFSFLQQPSVTGRGDGRSISEDVFADAARTRGALDPAAWRSGTAIQVFTLRVER